jgi:hypothetical protein
MAESPAYRLDERMAALAALEQQKPIESRALERGYEDLLQGNAESEPLRRQFARYLDERLGNHRAARNVLLPILAAQKDHGLASDALAASIARLHLEDGDANGAWALLEPRLSGMAASSAATRAQIMLGNLERAEEIARAAYARDPHSLAAAADLGAVFWGAKRHAEAAKVIAEFPSAASDSDRCWHFCRAFVRTFTGRPFAEPEAAFRELIAARLDPALLLGTIATFRSSAEAKTAFALGKLMSDRSTHRGQGDRTRPGDARQGQSRALAGEGSRATGWPRRPIYRRQTASVEALPRSDVPGGSATAARAAAFVREQARPASRGARHTSARRRRRTNGSGPLVGLIDAEALLATHARRRSQRAAYFLGARAEGARDFRGAMRLYQLALASPQRSPGRRLAHQAVGRIQGLRTSLDVLASERAPAAVLASGR